MDQEIKVPKNNYLSKTKMKCMFQQLTNQRWSRGQKARGQDQGNKKTPRPWTALLKTDPLEAKDRNARGQGQGPRTQAQVLSRKKSSSKIFFRRSPFLQKQVFKNFFQVISKQNGLEKFFQPIYIILTIQKIVLPSSRGQRNFRGLEALRPRPRT